MLRRAAAVLLLLLVSGCSGDPVRLDERDLRTAVLSFVAAQQDDSRAEYRRPTPAAREALAEAVLALGRGARDVAESTAAEQAYRVAELGDGALALVPSALPDDRGWGMYVVLPGGRALAVEVPHPRADLDTERLGAEVAAGARARFLLVAGADRDAEDGTADVARSQDSVFTAVHAALAGEGVAALQLHGFAATSLPGVDLVVSPGAAPTSDLARAVAREGERAGLEVCRAWQQQCGQLEGRRNAQGRASREAGAAFVHLEVTRQLRRTEPRRALVGLLVRAVGS